jgi:hypothetical protein
VNAAVVPPVTGDLVPGAVNVADQTGLLLCQRADEEKGRRLALSGQALQDPARTRADPSGVVTLLIVIESQSTRRLDAPVFLNVEAEDGMRNWPKGLPIADYFI